MRGIMTAKALFAEKKRLDREDRKAAQILHAVFRTPGISRTELCRSLNLNKNNMTSTIKAMLEHGYLRECGMKTEKTSGSGRRSIGLTLNPELFYVIGASLTLEDPALVLLNAERKVVEKVSLRNEGSTPPERFLNEIRQKCSYLLSLVNPDRVLGAGLALPGIINCEKGEAISSQAFAFNRENLKEFFQENLGLDIYMINISHIYPVMEKLYGGAAEMDNFVTVGEGLGCGMYFNGALYRGWQHSCGELGYMKISDHPEVGQDGRNGLLINQALFRLIGDKIIQGIRNGTRIRIERTWRDEEYIPPEAIVRAVEEGNMLVAEMLTDVYSHIGDAVVNVAYLLNPQAVFLPFWTARVKQFTVDVVRKKMTSYGVRSRFLKTEILSSTVPPSRRGEAVAYLFMDDYFQNIGINITQGGFHG